MPILNSTRICELVEKGQLIRNPLRDADGSCATEPASYDLRVGTILWKDRKTNEIHKKMFDGGIHASGLEPITVHPGQMIFVVTHEELQMPTDVCGTVYSRNKLQKKNILALNAGHIDPGYEGPIIIRLINLGAMEWPLSVGEPVFTVVFHTVQEGPNLRSHGRRTMEETILAAEEAALQAFSNPFFDLYESDIKRQLDEHYVKVEADLKSKLLEGYFPKNKVYELVMAGVIGLATLLTVIAAISRIPWRGLFDSFGRWLLGP